jgi:hypothetical protein
MNATPKTDECIKMLGEAQFVFSPIWYADDGSFDKNRCLDFQNRIKAMVDYRLMPMGIISIPNDADKETAKAHPILQNVGNFDAFWYAMKNYQLVTADDLKNEFWGVCPDLESIPRYLDAMSVKFDKVNYRYDTDIAIIREQCNGLKQLVEAEKISQQEADEILWNTHFVAKRYNFIMDYIKAIYGEFREMAQSQPESKNEPQQSPVIPKELDTDKAKQLFDRAIQTGFIDGTNGYKWLKSDTLLAYFVEKAGKYLGLSSGEYESVNGKNKTATQRRVSWKPFEILFNVEAGKMKRDKNNYYRINNDWSPDGHEAIDKIFE